MWIVNRSNRFGLYSCPHPIFVPTWKWGCCQSWVEVHCNWSQTVYDKCCSELALQEFNIFWKLLHWATILESFEATPQSKQTFAPAASAELLDTLPATDSQLERSRGRSKSASLTSSPTSPAESAMSSEPSVCWLKFKQSYRKLGTECFEIQLTCTEYGPYICSKPRVMPIVFPFYLRPVTVCWTCTAAGRLMPPPPCKWWPRCVMLHRQVRASRLVLIQRSE